MSSVTNVSDSFKGDTGDYFSRPNTYTRVHCLLIWWRENDVRPENEIKDLTSLLRDEFQYDISTFEIPNEGNLNKVINRKISDTIDEHSTKDNLLIIYYAGHCYKDEHGHARWAAQVLETGGPSLSWHVPQQLLFESDGDVLLLLDCCNAAITTRGVKASGRFEMIAACSMNSMTVGPGSTSFTRTLIKELKAKVKSGIFSDHLADRIRQSKWITESPVFHNFVQKAATKIWLEKMQEPQPIGFIKKPAGYMMFSVSLAEDLTGQEIANWLKTAAPKKKISAVQIEALVLRARQLQSYDVFEKDSFLGKLSPTAQAEIHQALNGLHVTMAATAQLTQGETNQARANEALGDIERSTEELCRAIETPLLQELDSSQQDAAGKDPQLEPIRASESIALRRAVLGADPDHSIEGLEIPRGKVQHTKQNERPHIRLAKLEGEPVIIEAFSYEPCLEQNGSFGPLEQVRRMSGLLSQAKRFTYHIMPCLGFYHDNVLHEIGLIFRSTTPITDSRQLRNLNEVLTAHKTVPLGIRIKLAHSLAEAMDHFHRVGWVHKSIRGSNIIFGPKFAAAALTEAAPLGAAPELSPRGKVVSDIEQPFLLGFEYSRPGDAKHTALAEDYSEENNMYRHPDRWGKPQVKFEKTHDVYALGIVLLEIALWKPIQSIVTKSPGARVRAKDVRRGAEDACRTQLPFRVGEVFTNVVLSCLQFDSTTEGKNEYDSQAHFQSHVISPLEKLVGVV